MRIGDARDATEIKYTHEPRITNAAIRNDLSLTADEVYVQGDVRLPGHVVGVQGRAAGSPIAEPPRTAGPARFGPVRPADAA